MRVKIEMSFGTFETESTGVMFSGEDVLVVTDGNGYSRFKVSDIQHFEILKSEIHQGSTNKIQKIKQVRDILHCSLLDAKNIIDNTPIRE